MRDVLSPNEIEEIAESLLRAFCGNKYPDFCAVDIERFVTEFCGCTLRYEKLSDSCGILGVTSYKDTTLKLRRNGSIENVFLPMKTILIEKSLKESEISMGRLRFTAAHECAHQILFGIHPDKSKLSYRNGLDPNLPCTPHYVKHLQNWSEYQANALAAALLMPQQLVDMVLFRFNNGLKLKLYGKQMVKKDRYTLYNMASFLSVSKQALLIRLKELKMVEIRPEEYFID